jgi:hypothetical protein
MEAQRGLHIVKIITDNDGKNLTELKNLLGNEYSFGDVRLGIAQVERNKEA